MAARLHVPSATSCQPDDASRASGCAAALPTVDRTTWFSCPHSLDAVLCAAGTASRQSELNKDDITAPACQTKSLVCSVAFVSVSALRSQMNLALHGTALLTLVWSPSYPKPEMLRPLT